MKKEILEKIKKLAYQNAFNDKQTKDFIDLVNSGTNIDKAIEITEKGDLPKKISAKTYDSEARSARHKDTIQEFKEAEEEGINIFAEWSTAGFNVCPLCEPLEGKVFELKEIEGMIPRHPDCRCVAIPANVGEERKEPIKTITRKQAEKLGEDNLKRVRREERLKEQEGEST